MTSSLVERELLRARWRGVRERLRLTDPTADDFATGGLACRLHGDALARLLILPADPEATVVEFDEDAWAWWLEDRTDPVTGETGAWSRGSDHAPTSEAMVRFRWHVERKLWTRYLGLHRNGGLEVGLHGGVVSEYDDTREFWLIQMVGRVWSALAVYSEVASKLGGTGPWEVTLAIRRTEGAHLLNLGEGWPEPRGLEARDLPRCMEPALMTRREVDEWPDDEGARDLAFRLGAWIEDSWGVRYRRFLARRGDRSGEFDSRRYGWD